MGRGQDWNPWETEKVWHLTLEKSPITYLVLGSWARPNLGGLKCTWISPGCVKDQHRNSTNNGHLAHKKYGVLWILPTKQILGCSRNRWITGWSSRWVLWFYPPRHKHCWLVRPSLFGRQLWDASKADLWLKISSFPVFVTEITTFSSFFVFFGYVFWTSPRSPRTRWSHSHFRVWTPAGPIYMCACININIYV